MSEANNFHSVIYSGHCHRGLLFNRAAPLQLVHEGKNKPHFPQKEEKEKKKRYITCKWGLASRQWKLLIQWTQRPFPILTLPLRKEDTIYLRDNWREIHNVRMLKKRKQREASSADGWRMKKGAIIPVCCETRYEPKNFIQLKHNFSLHWTIAYISGKEMKE